MCAHAEHFTRYHIIPVAYRGYFPVQVKSHRSHDVVLVCVDCHSRANFYTMQLKKTIAVEFEAPLSGIGTRGPSKEQMRIRRAASTLTNTKILNSIPTERREYLKRFVLQGLGLDPTMDLSTENLKQALYLGREAEGDSEVMESW